MKSRPLFVTLFLLLLLLIPTSFVLADTTYVVQPGDTLWGIATMFGVSIEDIAVANNLENIRLVSVGQTLVIPGVDGPLGSTPPPAPPPPTPAPQAPIDPSILTNPFTVQAPLDTLWEIAVAFGVSVEDLAAENNLDNIRVIGLGHVLYIPGMPLTPQTPQVPAATSSTTAPVPAPVVAPAPAVAISSNLLPNPSFEGDWYFYLYNELQVPTGWYIATDEGPNTLDPFNNNLFLRPECRVVSTAALPPHEHELFVFDGQKTIKVFKGGGPTSFSIFTDVYLQPGTYRMTINYFADTVVSYNGDGSKNYATDPLAAEARVIKGTGGTGWTSAISGQKNTLTYTFTVTSPGAVRVGGSFRSRYVYENNGWFLDDWSLVRVQ